MINKITLINNHIRKQFAVGEIFTAAGLQDMCLMLPEVNEKDVANALKLLSKEGRLKKNEVPEDWQKKVHPAKALYTVMPKIRHERNPMRGLALYIARLDKETGYVATNS